MGSKTVSRRYPCAMCGRQEQAERMVYSRHTRNRYCRRCVRRHTRAAA